VIAGRGDLDARFEELSKCYPEGEIPRPPHWADTASSRSFSSSGRGGRTGCTIGLHTDCVRQKTGDRASVP